MAKRCVKLSPFFLDNIYIRFGKCTDKLWVIRWVLAVFPL